MTSESTDVWYLMHTEDGKPYFYNRARMVTQWDEPEGYVIDAQRAEEQDEEDGNGKSVSSNNDDGDAADGNSLEDESAYAHDIDVLAHKRDSFAQRLRNAGTRIKRANQMKRGTQTPSKATSKAVADSLLSAGSRIGGVSPARSSLPKTNVAGSLLAAGSRIGATPQKHLQKSSILQRRLHPQPPDAPSIRSSLSSSVTDDHEDDDDDDDNDNEDTVDDGVSSMNNVDKNESNANGDDEDSGDDATQETSSPGTPTSVAGSRATRATRRSLLISLLPASRMSRVVSQRRSLGRSSMDIRPKRGPQVWEKKITATIGIAADEEDAGDVYYVNKETGESQWNRPDGYVSDDEYQRSEEMAEIAFDMEASIPDILEELGAKPQGNETPQIVEDRERMLDTGIDEEFRVENRLRQIFLAIKYCGSVEGWEAAVQYGDYQFVRDIYLHLGDASKVPSPVRSLTFILLETFEKLDGTLIRHYVDGDWGLDPEEFMINLSRGIEEFDEADDTSKFSILALCYSFLTEVPNLSENALPSDDTLERLIDCMLAPTEDVFLMATYVLIALNSHYGYTANPDRFSGPETGDEDMSITLDDEPNHVVRVLNEDSLKAEPFSEAILHLLNTSSYPYDDPVLLGQLLYMFRSLFSTKTTHDFFHLNDLKVMVDIILMQIRDLPLDDDFRSDYLRLLHLTIINSPWKGYRRSEILESLDEVLAAAVDGMNELSCKCALRILLDCVMQLS